MDLDTVQRLSPREASSFPEIESKKQGSKASGKGYISLLKDEKMKV